MEELDRKAANTKSLCQENQVKKRQVYDSSKVDSAGYKDMSSNFDEVKKFRNEKRQLLDKLNALKEKQRELEA